MNIKNSLLTLLMTLTIFFSYSYLQPMDDGFKNINSSEYTLKTYEANKANTLSTFKDEKNGNFLIHPGKKKALRSIFTFKKDGKIVLNFSIKKNSISDNIEFTIKKNKREFTKFLITKKEINQVLLEVKNGDQIEIIVDKHKNNSIWGNLQIKFQDKSFQFNNIIIPFLWIILFIFLLGKNHALIAINSYLIFLLMLFAEKLNFGALSIHTILTYMILLFSMTFIFTFIYQELTNLKKFKIAFTLSYITALLVYIVPLFFIIYALNFDTKVTKDILYAVFQSNSDESYEYIFDFISIKYILLFLFVTVAVGTFLYLQETKETKKIEKSLLIFMIIIFSSIALIQFTQLRLPTFIITGFNKYNEELKFFKQIQEKRKIGEIKFSATKQSQGETYIIVIGESLNKKHMGIYGYLRDTTPLLSKMDKDGEVIVFNNIYSNHTHTVPVLKYSLSEANQYNKKNYYDSLSIIEILNKSGIETYWLTNQKIYGLHENMISVIASSSNHLVTMNSAIGKAPQTKYYDDILIHELKKVLAKKTNKNRVIFVHLMGNHVRYALRYPKDTYSIYNDDLKIGEFGKQIHKKNNINFYDNSIVFNDYVVSSMIKELQKEKGINGFIYISDHADDVMKNLGHNSSQFTYEMTQIPMIGWFSENYKKMYGNKYSNLLNNTNRLYSNDMLYDTIIGMVGVKTDKYNVKYDFTSNNYNLNPDEALVLHGKKRYIDKDNYIYWQAKNAKYLIDTNQSSRIFPHRVNSVGKLHDIWNDGFRSFEVDVRFGDDDNNTFIVGHNKGVMGIGLEEFISKVNYTNIQRVWIDFKNLNKNNYKKSIERLEYLDKKFNIKNKFIIESNTKENFFKEFKKAGWHTSYYMPTKKVKALLVNNEKNKMEKLSIQIARNIKQQGLSAISFNHRLYPFVKKYLEDKIPESIVYHIWHVSPLESVHFKDDLVKNKLYLDARVKTLLSKYKSQFDL